MDNIRSEEQMNAKDASRMFDWFVQNGLSPEQYNSCLHYIANEAESTVTKEKSDSDRTND